MKENKYLVIDDNMLDNVFEKTKEVTDIEKFDDTKF